MRKPYLLLIAVGLAFAAAPVSAQVLYAQSGFSIGVGSAKGRSSTPFMLQQQLNQPSEPKIDTEKRCELSVGQAAVDACSVAANEKRDNDKLWRLLGDAYMATYRPREALPAYEAALRLKPSSVEALRGRDAAYNALASNMRPPAAQQPGGYAPPPAYAGAPQAQPGPYATAPMPQQASAAQPAGPVLDGEWTGTLTPRGKHFALAAKVENGRLVIDHKRNEDMVKAEGDIDPSGKVELRGKAADATTHADLEIKGQFAGGTFDGEGRYGPWAATMRLTRVGGPPPTTVAAAPAPVPAPVPAPQAAPAPSQTQAAAQTQKAPATTQPPAPVAKVDTTPPRIAVPSKVETAGAVVELNGKVSDDSKVVELTVNGQSVPLNKDGSFTVRRGVPVGNSELTLSAVDEWGNLAQKKVAVARSAAPETVDTAAAGAEQKTASRATTASTTEQLKGIEFGRFHALVIGNNKYQKVRSLETAANDARAVADLLKTSYGFEVELLLDGTRQQILETLYKMRAKLSEKDNLLVYYAGHGVVDKETGRGYWLPVDADPDLPTNWVPTTDLTDVIKAIQARHIMVVADSCYSGTLVRAADVKVQTARNEDLSTWVGRIIGKRSRTVMSSGGIEPVMDGGGGGHSVFAKAFIDALKANSSVLDGQGLFSEIRRPIVLNSDQTPEYSDIRQAGHDGGDFLFVKR